MHRKSIIHSPPTGSARKTARHADHHRRAGKTFDRLEPCGRETWRGCAIAQHPFAWPGLGSGTHDPSHDQMNTMPPNSGAFSVGATPPIQ
ncbi:conserved hypothethical protein (plasmid) [Ralstonia solanacearum PSI07]|uniref:Uncharacterized protein n=1 Tax=blood disease bacterium A2-HR MARDI TaxID=1944648 RepID=A0A1U9VPL3_9RALS|nr:hypothetical protein B0B51_22220 [blood disease bacterium A2-HR MARDI]CBJ35429.1 conserved hypothethical protein [Ralstonia solanacearum PSI07]